MWDLHLHNKSLKKKQGFKQLMKHWKISLNSRVSILCAEMLVDFGNRNIDGETDEEELLLLLQPHQLHFNLALLVLVVHQKVLAAVVVRQRLLCHRDANRWADAPEGFLKLVQQRQRYDAAVLRSVRNHHQRGFPSIDDISPKTTTTSINVQPERSNHKWTARSSND